MALTVQQSPDDQVDVQSEVSEWRALWLSSRREMGDAGHGEGRWGERGSGTIGGKTSALMARRQGNGIEWTIAKQLLATIRTRLRIQQAPLPRPHGYRILHPQSPPRSRFQQGP
jgi:hypothetical protein